MSAPLHVVLVSSVPPRPEIGGGLIPHRHLLGSPHLRCDYYGGDPTSRAMSAPALVERLQKTRLFRLSEAFWVWRAGRWLDAGLRQKGAAGDVIVTVAHGDAASSAVRYARARQRPLVTFFHDWWPDVSLAPAALRPTVERRFRALYAQSAVALCVSEGMRAALGPHPRSEVLVPIPRVPSVTGAPAAERRAGPFRVLYAGNLVDYDPMLARARGFAPASPPRVPSSRQQSRMAGGVSHPGPRGGPVAGSGAARRTRALARRGRRFSRADGVRTSPAPPDGNEFSLEAHRVRPVWKTDHRMGAGPCLGDSLGRAGRPCLLRHESRSARTLPQGRGAGRLRVRTAPARHGGAGGGGGGIPPPRTAGAV